MVPLVALLAFPPKVLTVEDAVAVARTFLKDVDIPVQGGLKKATENAEGGWGRPTKTWDVVFDRPKGGWLAVNLDARGTVFRVCSSDFAKAGHPKPSKEIELGRLLLAKLPNAVLARPFDNDSDTFYAIVNGYRYFNLNPTYGYRFDFDPEGRLTLFLREDTLPPPVASEPTVDQYSATAQLNDAWQSAKPDGWPDATRIRPELGYYVVQGEQTARLVWRGKLVEVYKGQALPMGHLKVAVDAMTGELIEAGDQ